MSSIYVYLNLYRLSLRRRHATQPRARGPIVHTKLVLELALKILESSMFLPTRAFVVDATLPKCLAPRGTR